jgi:hypothetical protein
VQGAGGESGHFGCVICILRGCHHHFRRCLRLLVEHASLVANARNHPCQGTASIDTIVALMHKLHAKGRGAETTTATLAAAAVAAADSSAAGSARAAAAAEEEDAAAAERSVRSLLARAAKSAWPLPRGAYAAFEGYPRFIVDWQVSAHCRCL